MQYSDTTNKNGILQTVEFWCGMADGEITGNATLKAVMTARVNSAFDRVLPIILPATTSLKWDDLNHSDVPIATFNLVSGQGNYTIETDDNSLDVLRVAKVRILTSSSATQYTDVEDILLSDNDAWEAMSPNSVQTGIPSKILVRGNTIHFLPKPNYSATAGAKVFFEREPSYFATSDTTKEPGIPKISHELLALYPAHDWLLVYKPENTSLISRVEAQIARREGELRDLNERRYRETRRMTPAMHDNR